MVYDHYSLLMERFPALALLLPHLGTKITEKEEVFFNTDSEEVIYFLGLKCEKAYLHAKSWLQSDPKKVLIFLLEKIEELPSFLHEEMAKEILENPQVVIGLKEDIETFIQEYPFAKIDVFTYPSKQGKDFDEWRETLLRKAFLSWAQHLDRAHGYQIFDNFLNNLTMLPSSFYANGLKGKFAGVPAIICGAGPSLQENIDLLKKIDQQALIIAGGSTLAALSSHGITPHFGIAIDPNFEEVNRLKNSFAFEMPFLYSTRLFHDCFQTCNGPFGYMRSGIGGLLELWVDEFLGLNEPFIGKELDGEALSVTSICLAWAQFLGCNPIFLTGIDLAYTQKARYAEGIELYSSPFVKEAEIGVDRKVWKKNESGVAVETALRWVMESSCFSRFVNHFPECKFFNLNPHGLKIDAIPYLSSEKVVALLPEKKDLKQMVFQEISQSFFSLNTEEKIKHKIQELEESLDRVISHLEILTKEKKGSSALAELELGEEMCYSLLFYDIEKIEMREARIQGKKEEPWLFFLTLARKYKIIFMQWKKK